MTIRFHRDFERQYKKLSKAIKNKLQERLKIFMSDEFHPILNNHPLQGKYRGYRSINVMGDFRAIYTRRSKEIFIFVTVNTHSKLYG